MRTVGSPAKLRPNSCMLRSSRPKSSSRRKVRCNSVAMARGRWIASSGIISPHWDNPTRISRSTWNLRCTSGCCTLTTTRSPLLSRARCTWPMEADARALGSNSAKTSSRDRRRSFSTDARTASGGVAGTSSWRCCNSAANSVPTRSGRVLSSCPSLMNAGPSSVKASRIRVGQVCRAMATPSRSLIKSLANSGPKRLIQSASPKRLKTARISLQRARCR